MNSENSHRITWVTILGALPLIYLLSVPPLWVNVCKVHKLSSPIGDTKWMTKDEVPAWFNLYTKPYYLVANHTPAKGPLEAYMDWVFELSQ
jgi:hypothetical protein